jgi:putative ATP-dependent endonuclease of the OLD family
LAIRVRDDDKKPTAEVEEAFISGGGEVVAWRNGRALEDELFLSLTDDAVDKLIDRAVELHGEDLVDDHIKSVSQNAKNLNGIRTEVVIDGILPESRAVLGKAARTKKAGWFKSVTWMEDVARDIVGPDLANADAGFRARVERIFAWAGDAGG